MTDSHPQPSEVQQTTVAIRGRWTVIFPVAGALIGLIAAFIIGPVVAWLLNRIGDAPGPLRLAAMLPLVGAVPVLMILGAVAGFILLAQWQEETGKIRVDAHGLTVEREDGKRRVARDRIGETFTDGEDLVVVTAAGEELLRSPVDDELATQLGGVLERYSYPYSGSRDPREELFAVWVDGEDALDAETEALLRDRHRAKLDKQPGRMQQLAEELAGRGIVVRDRKETQEYRVIDGRE